MIRSLGSLATAVAALTLAGCATASGPGASASARTAASAAPPVATEVAAALPSEAERDPDRLRGLDPEAVTGLIGVPHFIRREGGATVWQYHAGGCVMDLFWYATAGKPRLVHYEVRGVRLAGVAEASSCFGNLLVHKRRDATS